MLGCNTALFWVELNTVPSSIFSHVRIDACVYVEGVRAGVHAHRLTYVCVRVAL